MSCIRLNCSCHRPSRCRNRTDRQACENLVRSVYHLDKFIFHPVVFAPLEAGWPSLAHLDPFRGCPVQALLGRGFSSAAYRQLWIRGWISPSTGFVQRPHPNVAKNATLGWGTLLVLISLLSLGLFQTRAPLAPPDHSRPKSANLPPPVTRFHCFICWLTYISVRIL